MSRVQYNTMSGMDLELKRQEMLAENLAASSVPGYKNQFLVSHSFQKIYDNQSGLNGVSGGQVKVDYAQGELHTTGRRLDFAIHGEGFFKVRSEDGKTMYTRNGTFTLSNDKKLITDDGFTVLDNADGEIRFAPDDNLEKLEVMPNGMLKIIGEVNQNYAYRQLGQLNVTQISNKEDLDRLSGNYFQMKKDQQPKPFATAPPFTVTNAMLESSNVSPIKTMTMLIQSSRDFEMSNRLMRSLVDLGEKERNTFQS